MNKLYNFLLTLCCFAILSSCNNSETEDNPNKSPEVIALSAKLDPSISMSRSSIGSFPNNGRIGVTAGYFNSDPSSTDWKSYPDIFDTRATALLSSGNSYTFTWDSPKYWPLDSKQLVFMAYSPPINETNGGFTLDAEGKNVSLKLYDGMPDFMYATANATATTTPYSKTPIPTVDLGEFQHAFSKLTVEVIEDDAMIPAVKLSSLSVTTAKKSATFDLTQGVLSSPADEGYTYSLVLGSIPFPSTDTIRKSVFLFPNTEDVTKISIGLMDNTIDISHDYMMSVFQNVTNIGSPITLERGKNTTLRIKIKGTEVTNLQGVLSDWNRKGNFGITIK